ncbi:MAG TPA: lysylphosphatidylglycerol synthase transmembrane domain-containing protein [Verrucomicrobiae bacterium]|nr:lysylphosphatidylglycerol synthase transmembrane domain-containing protein [Verrucomicrobiae bacterium]
MPENKSKYVRILASYLVAGACLFWVFHDIHFHPLVAAMAHIRWWLWLLCVGMQFLAYFCVAYEWQLLLRPIGRIPLKRSTQAVFAGRFANDVLPFQMGYLIRCILVARWMNVGVVSIFPSLIMERLWDGIWLAAGIGLVALLLPLPPDVLRAAKLFGAMVLAGTAATVLVVLYRSRAGASRAVPTSAETNPLQRIWHAVGRLTDGVRDIVQSGLLAPVLGLSLLKLALQAAAFLGFLQAYDLPLSLPAGAVVFLAGYLGMCVPSTPAGTGMFQLFVVAGLGIFGVDKSVAAGFALITFVSITIPLAVAGFFALAQSGVRLSAINK